MTRKKGSITPSESSNHWTTSRAPRINEFHEVLEGIAWVWRILGIFPIIVKDSQNKKRYGFSKFYAFYSLLYFAICITHFIYTVITFDEKYSKVSLVLSMTIYSRLVASLICLVLTNVVRVIRFKELSESINDLWEQEVFLEKIIGRFDYESRGRIIRAYVWSTFSIIIIATTYDYYVSYLTWKTFSPEWLLWTYPLIIQWMNLTLLVSLCGSLGLTFRSLNRKMKSVVTRANASSPKVIVTSNVCAESLRVLSKAHYETCAIGKRINRIFNCDVIINVTLAFLVVSTTLYNIFYEIQRKSKVNAMIIIVYVSWGVIYSGPIIILVIICNWTSSQAIYAGELIHEIRVEKTNSRLYNAIKSFSLQLHHQKLEFTAGGFFPLDSSLLQTMIGTITTYLVILIQFQPKLDYTVDE